jgi:hypothetical protein
MAAVRRLMTLAVLAVALAGTASCVDISGPVTPVTTPSATGSETASGAPGPSTVVTAATTPAAGASYPGTAQGYAEAVLQAWRIKQFTRLTDLTSPAVLTQLQTTGNIESDWSFVNCQGAAGSSYCQYLNGDGDSATLRLDNQLLGRAHAATEVKLDLTTYSNNAVEYVKAFIEAWRNANTKRMTTLANATEVTYFTHYAPPGAYSTCATLAGGTASVRVYNADGLNYTLNVSVATLGAKHAITGHATTPAACP